MNYLIKKIFILFLLCISLTVFGLPEFRLKSRTDIETYCKPGIASIDYNETEFKKIGSCYKLGSTILTRAEFVKDIEEGKYPQYHIYEINGIKYPRSNANETTDDNLTQR